jgi:EAL domain-containing protein (putative c-di-GMP-specific phosphodiesterase class I)
LCQRARWNSPGSQLHSAAGLPDHAEHAAQVAAILVLAGALDIEVIAEGVETQAERAFLEERGCAGLQGYLVSAPLESGAARAFLESQASD